MSGWEPLPSWVTPYLNASSLVQLIQNPLAFLRGQVGDMLLFAGIYAVSVFAGWMHTKSLLGAGVISLLFSPVMLIPGELRYAGMLALAFGAGAIVWELAKRVV